MAARGFTFQGIFCHSYLDDDEGDPHRRARIETPILEVISEWYHPTEGKKEYATTFMDVHYDVEEKTHVCATFKHVDADEVRQRQREDDAADELARIAAAEDDQRPLYSYWDCERWM